MSWKSFIKSHLDSLQSQIFTTLPAIVTDVSNLESEQTISVRPTIDILHSDGQVNECPQIFNVPVIFPSAGGGILSFPVQVGDNVLVQFSMRNLENWLEGDGGSVVENTMRSHDLSDAIALVGLTTKANTLSPSPKDVVLKFKDNSVTLFDDGNVEVVTKSKIEIKNDQEELIALLSELIQTVSEITTNTIYSGFTPVNNKAAFTALKSRLDTLKK